MSGAPEGLLVVDKPGGWTSHDVVARVRRLAGLRRVGHAGTLDPMATGVLVLGLGRATRLLGHLSLTDKGYDAVVRLGETTVTDDAEGEVVRTGDPRGVTDEGLRQGLLRLTGTIAQVPSSVSAVKVGGVRSYARVRAGEEVVLAPRQVTVSALELTARHGRDVSLRVSCSSGTYVRALARDLGEDLGCGAHLLALRRTRVGRFALDGAVDLDRLGAEDLPGQVLPLDASVDACFTRRELTADETVELSHGRPLDATGTTSTVAAFDPAGHCVALVTDRDGRCRPLVVFAPARVGEGS